MIFYFIIAAIITLFDRATKILIETRLDLGDSYKIIENILYMSRSKNSGVAFGVFQNGGLLLKISSSVLIIVVIYMMFINKNKIARIGFTFILGGALGNFYDRLFLNGVTDFIDIPPLSFIFPNFNIADFFIVIGTIITAIYLLFIETNENKNKIVQKEIKIEENKDNINGE